MTVNAEGEPVLLRAGDRVTGFPETRDGGKVEVERGFRRFRVPDWVLWPDFAAISLACHPVAQMQAQGVQLVRFNDNSSLVWLRPSMRYPGLWAEKVILWRWDEPGFWYTGEEWYVSALFPEHYGRTPKSVYWLPWVNEAERRRLAGYRFGIMEGGA
ncbi:MAG: hypothetical protein FOGNACKC_00731 [Anaerolineae bacterium]|nr:hypothetical protein [Anaerolineae bacterium]